MEKKNEDILKAVSALREICMKQKEELDMIKSWNPLYKKRIYFLGSSWTYGSACNGKDNFAMRIAAKNLMEYYNESVSGTTFVLRDGRNDSYFERADQLPNIKPDYLLIQLSSNDSRHTQNPIGHATDFYQEDEQKGLQFDLYSMAGSMEATISKLMRRYPGTKFAWYTGFQGPVLDSLEAKQRLVEARRVLLEEIAPKWGTPVCDLTCHLGLNTYIVENRRLLTKDDGQHCLSAGYALWETAIEGFLKAL